MTTTNTTPSNPSKPPSSWEDSAAIAGAVLVMIGAAQVYAPLAWIWAGGCLLALALRAAAVRARDTEPPNEDPTP